MRLEHRFGGSWIEPVSGWGKEFGRVNGSGDERDLFVDVLDVSGGGPSFDDPDDLSTCPGDDPGWGVP